MFTLPDCYNSGDAIPIMFDSYDSNGASVTITGFAVTDIEIYKGTSMTQRASDNGYALMDTDGIDIDSVTGLHGFSIDTSDNSDSGFWADGNTYHININAITVDSQTVRFTYMLALGYTLRPTTAGRKLDVSTGGEAGLDWANVGSPTTTVGLSGTTVKTATDVETDTADLQSRTPAALGANGNMKSDVRDLLGTAWLTPGTAGTPDVNMRLLSGDSGAADNLEASFDGTGYRANLYLREKPCVTFAVGTVNSTTSYELDVPGGFAAIDDYTDWIAVFRDVSSSAPYLHASIRRVTGTGESTPGLPTITINAAPNFTVVAADVVELYPPDLELLTRITDTRAGYLDNLSAGAVATAANLATVDTVVDGIASALTTVGTNVSTLLTRIPAALFSGITSMAHWLGAIMGKQAGNATALTEIRASGAGSGTYDPTTDSLEALIDSAETLDQVADAIGQRNLSVTPTTGTWDEALAAARAQGIGRWALNGSTRILSVYAHDGTTVLETILINPDLTAPLTRTPQ